MVELTEQRGRNVCGTRMCGASSDYTWNEEEVIVFCEGNHVLVAEVRMSCSNGLVWSTREECMVTRTPRLVPFPSVSQKAGSSSAECQAIEVPACLWPALTETFRSRVAGDRAAVADPNCAPCATRGLWRTARTRYRATTLHPSLTTPARQMAASIFSIKQANAARTPGVHVPPRRLDNISHPR